MGRPGECRRCGEPAVRWNRYNLVVSCDACGATVWPWHRSYAQMRLGELLDTYHRLLVAGRLIYATHEAIPAGMALYAPETDWYYAYAVFHDEAEAKLAAQLARLELWHLRDAPRKPAPWLTGPFDAPEFAEGSHMRWRP